MYKTPKSTFLNEVNCYILEGFDSFTIGDHLRLT
jgi:hypothetical protein